MDKDNRRRRLANSKAGALGAATMGPCSSLTSVHTGHSLAGTSFRFYIFLDEADSALYLGAATMGSGGC
jgi:hypothetical protein